MNFLKAKRSIKMRTIFEISPKLKIKINELDKEIQNIKKLKSELVEKYNYVKANHKLSRHYGLDAQVKASYFEKFDECIDTINLRLNQKWMQIDKLYLNDPSFSKRENWNEIDQKLLDSLNQFIEEEKKYKAFDQKMVAAFKEEDKKY
jgi:hypothetical protein